MVALAGAQRDSKGAWAGVLDEHPAIAWATQPTSEAVAALNCKLAAGDVTLTFGYLRSVLDALDVPVASADAGVSRSGVQRAATQSGHPRASSTTSRWRGLLRPSFFLELIAYDAGRAPSSTRSTMPATGRRCAERRRTTRHVASVRPPGLMTRSLAAGPGR